MKNLKLIFILVAMMIITGCNDSNEEKTFEVGYNIFPIAFSDSNGDGIGDINGITEKLDYIQDLGVDTIWLNPIHQSNSYHKYDVIDYYSIDEQFGTIQDFENLINEAHKRNINVMMDLVVNHTSTEHEWFQSAINDENSKYRDYYTFHDFENGFENYKTKDGWAQLDNGTYYFASFWGGMPELNFENEKVTEEMYKIADFWLEKGVDGFRLDAIKHLYDIREYPTGTPVLKYNFEWFEAFKVHVQSVNNEAFVLGEMYDKYQSVVPYYSGFDSLFNFSIAEEIINTVITETNGDFVETLEKSYKGMLKYNENGLESYFISNHDQDRIMSRVKGDYEKAELASHILMTLPGMSWIYYGEEIGMQGEGIDEHKREPINWGDEFTTSWEPIVHNKNIVTVKEQLDDENSLLSKYKTIIQLKKENKTFIYGTFEGIESDKNVLSYKIYDDENSFLVVHNLSSENVQHNRSGEIIYTNGVEQDYILPYKTVIFQDTY